MFLSSLKPNQRGDTIIEVLIAIAIVTTVLAGAFVSANNSFNTTQGNKDRDEALRVAQTQLERLRSIGSTTDKSCISAAPAAVTNSGFEPDVAIDNLSTGANYNAGCKVSFGGGATYHVNIAASGSDYAIHVRWQRAGGGTNQETIIRYRLYQ